MSYILHTYYIHQMCDKLHPCSTRVHNCGSSCSLMHEPMMYVSASVFRLLSAKTSTLCQKCFATWVSLPRRTLRLLMLTGIPAACCNMRTMFSSGHSVMRKASCILYAFIDSPLQWPADHGHYYSRMAMVQCAVALPMKSFCSKIF